MDEAFAADNNNIYKAASAAAANQPTIAYLKSMYSNPNTTQGFGAEGRTTILKAFAILGVKAGNPSDTEVARALSNKLPLTAKNDGGENTMPRSLSDGDRQFLQLMVPNIGNTREANLKLLGYYDLVQRRQQDINGLCERYVQMNGRIDEGFRRELNAYARANLLFADQPGYSGTRGLKSTEPSRPTFKIIAVE